MLVFCILHVQGTAIFMGSSQEKSILLYSHNMRQDKFVSKFMVHKGQSVLPIQNWYFLSSCAHQSVDLPPLYNLNLWM
jgi:hypothetical protein